MTWFWGESMPATKAKNFRCSMHNFGHLLDNFKIVLDGDDPGGELPLFVARRETSYSGKSFIGQECKTIPYPRTGLALADGGELQVSGHHHIANLCGRGYTSHNHTSLDSNGHVKWGQAMEGEKGRPGCEVLSTSGFYTCSRNLNGNDLSLRHWLDVKRVNYVACPTDHNRNTSRRRYAHAAKQVSHKSEIRNHQGRPEHLLKKAGVTLSSTRQVLSPLVMNTYDDRAYMHAHSSRHVNGKQEVTQKTGIKRRHGVPRRKTHMGQATAGLSNFRKEIISHGLPQGSKGLLLDDEVGMTELRGSRCGLSSSLSQRKNPRDLSVKQDSRATSKSYGRVHREVDMEAVLGLSARANKGGFCTEGNGQSASDCPGKLVPDAENDTPRRKNIEVGVDRCEHATPLAGKNGAESVERSRNLSQKYRPQTFKDVIGQNLVAHTLSNATSMGKVAPAYLFQGSHGTGKTSTARIFAAALNCVTSRGNRPCGVCTECAALVSGKSRGLWEIEAASHNECTSLKGFIEGMLSATSGPRYRVLAIDGCHVLSHETWCTLLKVLEEPPAKVVFILITTQPQKLPLTVVSRCQSFHFLKIRHLDIVKRLENLLKLENLDAEPGALNLIASKSQGSLRDAEITLDQLSLLEHRITQATIHALAGSVPDDQLVSLLDFALCSDTASTVRVTRDLINSRVEPLDLLCQLASLIVDILVGSCKLSSSGENEVCSSIHALSDLDIERLKAALKILLEAEKQVKAASKYRTTWLIAALLRFGHRQGPKLHGSTPNTIPKAPLKVTKSNEAKPSKKAQTTFAQRDLYVEKKGSSSTKVGLEAQVHPLYNDHTGSSATFLAAKLPYSYGPSIDLHLMSPSNLRCIWQNVLEACMQPFLARLLQCHGVLKALTFFAARAVAQLEFVKPEHKLEAEMYKVCIRVSLERVLGLPVDVNVSLVPKVGVCKGDKVAHSSPAAQDAGVMQQSALTLNVGSAINNTNISDNVQSGEERKKATLRWYCCVPVKTLAIRRQLGSEG